jgi:hypothetical protein
MFRASDRAGSVISDKATTKPKSTIPENLLLLIISPPVFLRLLNDEDLFGCSGLWCCDERGAENLVTESLVFNGGL